MRFMLMVLALAAAGLTAACGVTTGQNFPQIRGSGTRAEAAREVPTFEEISVSDVIQADVTPGPKSAVTLSGDDNLLPLVATEVVDGRLRIHLQENRSIRTVSPLTAAVTVPALTFASAEGASRVRASARGAKRFEARTGGASAIELTGLEVDELVVKAGGASSVTAAGRAKRLVVILSGSSKLHARGLAAASAEVDLDGAAQGEVRAEEAVTGSVHGASHLRVSGHPGRRDVDASRASDVRYESTP